MCDQACDKEAALTKCMKGILQYKFGLLAHFPEIGEERDFAT